MPRRKPFLSLKNGVRTGHGVKIDVVIDRLRIDLMICARVPAQHITRRSEYESTLVNLVNEATDPKAVGREERFTAFGIDHRQGEISLQRLERSRSVRAVALEK